MSKLDFDKDEALSHIKNLIDFIQITHPKGHGLKSEHRRTYNKAVTFWAVNTTETEKKNIPVHLVSLSYPVVNGLREANNLPPIEPKELKGNK